MTDSDLSKEITLDIKESRTDSKASGREPEIPFDKSTSGFSTDDTSTIGPSRPESSVEYLMTAQEIQELDNRLEEVVDRLQRQREDYEKWENGLNKRRLEAYGKLKALGKFHRQRMEVYDTVKEYLQTMNASGHSRSSKK
ncbi:uncharacterized protein LOC132717029 [Ruditapes philippinarum]|uniref:uncharacterized protein LOC132717029 n=1 Tax=Ruditapes philippinarum TaxID=129788 RepID=UPI00295AB374|nr:uncharacterized protein LOC132717029 [Ruditapes philippinarum]